MGRILVADVAKVAEKNKDRIVAVEKEQIGMKGCIKENTEDIAKQELACESGQKAMKAMEKFAIEAGVTLRFMKYVGGAIGLSILGLIMSLIFGQASIVFH